MYGTGLLGKHAPFAVILGSAEYFTLRGSRVIEMDLLRRQGWIERWTILSISRIWASLSTGCSGFRHNSEAIWRAFCV